jgi:predicted HicB family RNase H-like nuclease
VQNVGLSGIVRGSRRWARFKRKARRSASRVAGQAGKNFSGKFILRTSPELHRALALRALQAGDSLNNFVVKKLQAV